MSQATQPPKRSIIQRSLLLNLLLIALITCLIYILFFSSLAGITSHNSEIKVPPVTGKDGAAAIRELESLGFEVHVDSTYDPYQKGAARTTADAGYRRCGEAGPYALP